MSDLFVDCDDDAWPELDLDDDEDLTRFIKLPCWSIILFRWNRIMYASLEYMLWIFRESDVVWDDIIDSAMFMYLSRIWIFKSINF